MDEIITFRGVELRESEANVLTELESLSKQEFAIFEELPKDVSAGIVVKGAAVIKLALRGSILRHLPESIEASMMLQVGEEFCSKKKEKKRLSLNGE